MSQDNLDALYNGTDTLSIALAQLEIALSALERIATSDENLPFWLNRLAESALSRIDGVQASSTLDYY